MRSAVTPVISVTLLIFITLVAGVGAYAWFNTIQSDLQESTTAGVENFPGSDCSQLNLIAMRGDGIVVSNTGCDTIGTINIFIDGVLTTYDLNEPLEPGQASTISYTALEAYQAHTVQVTLNNGKTASKTIPKEQATTESGFREPGCDELTCSSPNVMFYGKIMNTINNATCACCGDDGFSDVFYNSTYMCSYGGEIFDADNLNYNDWFNDNINHTSGRGVCELKGYKWLSGYNGFGSKADYTIVSTGPVFLASGDIDNDDDLDLAITRSDSSVNNFIIMKNNGDGTFDSPVYYSFIMYPRGIELGDFDNDGDLDVAIASYTASGKVVVIYNDGTGSFGGKTDYSTGTSSWDVDLGDFNNDNYIDMAVSNKGSSSISILLNNGDGTFASQVSYTTASNPFGISVMDVNNDDVPDVAVASYNNLVSVLLGIGDGTFADKSDYSIGFQSYDVSIGDFNNDGWADLVTTNRYDNDITILLNDGDGTFSGRTDYSVGGSYYPNWVSVNDLDNDNDLDIAVSESNDYFTIFLGRNDGTFAGALNYLSGNGLYGIISADFDKDGDLDIATADNDEDKISILFNQGINGDNGPCCGDDGASDDFSNSTHQCVNGVFSAI